MIQRKYIDKVKSWILSKSAEAHKYSEAVKDLEKVFKEFIESKYDSKVFEYCKLHPDSVYFQGDFDFFYEVNGLSWDQLKNFGHSYLTIQFPPNYPKAIDFHKIWNGEAADDSYKDLCSKVAPLKTKIERTLKNLSNMMEKSSEILKKPSMNKTSIKTYYPELYKIMFDEEGTA